MYLKAVKYKNYGWLAPGSDAMKLYEAMKFNVLDKHCKALDDAKAKLEGIKHAT